MKTTSISRQLIAGMLTAELVCAVLLSCVAILHEMHGRKNAFDVMLRGRADSLLGAVQDAVDVEDNVIVDPTELVIPRQDAYEVLSPSGKVIGRSEPSGSDLSTILRIQRDPGYFSFKTRRGWFRGIRFNGVRVIDREENGGLRRPVIVVYASPTGDLWRESIEAVKFYVGACVLLLTGTAFALVWLLRRRLSPLQELATLAGSVSARSWRFDPPASILRTAELAPIAQSLGELVKSLQESFERQRQLTGDAAHELKTCIAVLKSSLQLLILNPRTQQQYARGLEGLLADTGRMEDLATRMLALARLEESNMDQQELTELRSALQTVANRLRPLARVRQVNLEVEVSQTAQVSMHAYDAETLCSNLILNAVQHTAPAGRVSVAMQTNGSSTELRVTDNGEGIPESALPHIFERFYRADHSRSRDSGGAGLGLSICKAIVERSQGSIQIESVRGIGTSVRVSLPVCTTLT